MKQILVKKIYKMLVPGCVRNCVFNIRVMAPHLLHLKKYLEQKKIIERYKERFVSYGEEHPDKTFYVIYIRYATNLVSFIRMIIPYLQYAEKNDWIPIIDQKNYGYTFLGKRISEMKDENVWEWFFEQPAGFSLEDIKSAKNVRYCNPLRIPEGYSVPQKICGATEEMIGVFYKYIRLKSFVKDKIIAIADSCKFNPQKKYVGVNIRCEMLRGAMVKSNLYLNHRYTTKEQLFDGLQKVKSMHEKDAYGVFIVCDDSFVKEKLAKQFFSSEALWLDRHSSFSIFFENGDLDKPLSNSVFYANYQRVGFSQKIENLYEYLADIYALSKCDAVLCGEEDSVPFMAILLRGAQFSKIVLFETDVFNGKTEKKKYFYEHERGYVALC